MTIENPDSAVNIAKLKELTELGKSLSEFCQRFFIPKDCIFEILEDQKVVPMIRGKAMEHMAATKLKSVLDPYQWKVEKLNISAQPGELDEDISVTHSKTGIRIKIESKSAVRGSMTRGVRSRLLKNTPHFKVKCHRSRSNTKKLETGNDSYRVEDFDLILTTPLNAIYEGSTIGRDFELVPDPLLIKHLHKKYGTSTDKELEVQMNEDWHFVEPIDIAVKGLIPRTPYVLLDGEPNWKPISTVEKALLGIVAKKKTEKKSLKSK